MLLKAALTLVVLAGTYSFASARSAYDGGWTVTMASNAGSCASSFYFGVVVRNGIISASGGGFNLSGRVTSRGTVSASIGSGEHLARAYGYLSRSSGSGRWVSPSRGWSGAWSARRS